MPLRRRPFGHSASPAMPSANASVLHIVAPPSVVFTTQHPANASALYIIAPPAHMSEHIEHGMRM